MKRRTPVIQRWMLSTSDSESFHHDGGPSVVSPQNLWLLAVK